MLLIPSLTKKTRKAALATLDAPAHFYMPLNAYRGIMKAVVAAGERVRKYQLIAESGGLFASKLHAPASGTVTGFLEVDGQPVLHLQNDFLETEVPPVPADPLKITPELLAQLLLDNGIQGAGGSQFPTQLKYGTGEKKITTLIFNGVECEPYLTADFTLMNEKVGELLQVAELLQAVLGVERVVFAIERQNRVVRKVLLAEAAALKMKIEVKVLPDGYPQGGELQLIRSVTGLELKKGSLPVDFGMLVNNIGTLWAIYNAVLGGRPCIERVVTVSGDSSTNPVNVLARIGTPVAHLLRETHNAWNPEEQTLVLGGAMMGRSITSAKTPIHKGAGGILLMHRKKAAQNNCIKCGVCTDVCPQRLMPLEFARHNLSGDLDALKRFHLQDCIACGACAYVCPSDVPLMESIFEGKARMNGAAAQNPIV